MFMDFFLEAFNKLKKIFVEWGVLTPIYALGRRRVTIDVYTECMQPRPQVMIDAEEFLREECSLLDF